MFAPPSRAVKCIGQIAREKRVIILYRNDDYTNAIIVSAFKSGKKTLLQKTASRLYGLFLRRH